MEDGRCKLGLLGRLELVTLIEQGAMGIAGGEVGVSVADAARVVAHVQFLVVVGAVAGAGGQILYAVTGGDGTDGEPPPDDAPQSPVLCLYRAVWEQLAKDGGASALRELRLAPELEFLAAIGSLAPPAAATEEHAREVFDRICGGDLEFAARLPFWGTPLFEAVRPFSPEFRPKLPDA